MSVDRDGGIGRVLAFSYGVFAIAITLLVLDLKVPDLMQIRRGAASGRTGAYR